MIPTYAIAKCLLLKHGTCCMKRNASPYHCGGGEVLCGSYNYAAQLFSWISSLINVRPEIVQRSYNSRLLIFNLLSIIFHLNGLHN